MPNGTGNPGAGSLPPKSETPGSANAVGTTTACAGGERLTPEQLKAAREAQSRAGEAAERLPSHLRGKTVASDGTKTISGYKPDEEIPPGFTRNEDVGGEAMIEHARGLEEHGYKPTRSGGLDGDVPGQNAATHAEKQLARYQEVNNQDTPIGVSEEQCGDCRKWFRAEAQSTGKTQIVADPQYTRAYQPGGSVDIYDSNDNFVRSVPPGEQPQANMNNYERIPW